MPLSPSSCPLKNNIDDKRDTSYRIIKRVVKTYILSSFMKKRLVVKWHFTNKI